MRKFSVRPTLTLKGRTFKGLRGWSGKPLHPPLTDFPIAAYVIAAVFDVVSTVGGKGHGWAREFWHAGTFTFVAGAAVSVFAALTGLWDHTEAVTPIGVVVLSVVIAILVSVGATFGGSLVYDYGFNVETAGDSPVWHKSETDVFPGQHDTSETP